MFKPHAHFLSTPSRARTKKAFVSTDSNPPGWRVYIYMYTLCNLDAAVKIEYFYCLGGGVYRRATPKPTFAPPHTRNGITLRHV